MTNAVGTQASAAQTLFNELRQDGEAALARWRDEQREESVHLECKLTASSDKPGMARSDIDQLAKTASAFANSEGGVIIFGVDARDADGRDCIKRLVPVSDLAAFHRSAEGVRADLLSPPHSGIELLAISSPELENAGYLAVRIEQSDRRPHRSMKDQVYYRRSRDRTSPMEHSDLRDAMSRAASPALHIAIDIVEIVPLDARGAEDAGTFRIMLAVSITNDGGTMARFPFLHLQMSDGGGLYNDVTDKIRKPAWPLLVWEGNEKRLQGGTDDVIPVATTVRAAFIAWTYDRVAGSIGGLPIGQAFLGIQGRFGCDGAQTKGLDLIIQPHEVVAELGRRRIPLSPPASWNPR